MMAFIGVEFSEQDGGGVALICSKWLTPRKLEVLWPPVKTQDQYEKALKKAEPADEETWVLYKVARCFFETDDLAKAKQKIKKAEYTSELSTEDDEQPVKRPRIPNRRLFSSADDSDEELLSNLKRPPKVVYAKTFSGNRDHIIGSETVKFSRSEKTDAVSSDLVRIETASCSGSTKTTAVSELSFTPTSKDTEINIPDYKKLMSLMIFIKEQNTQILKELKNNNNHTTKRMLFGLPEDIPVKFPIADIEGINIIEDYLKEKENLAAVVSYLSTLGGRDVTTKTNTVLRTILTNKVAENFSFLGTRKEKKAFVNLNLKIAVIRAVQIESSATECEISENIKTWLKHAPQRLKLEMNKRKNKSF